MEVQKAEMIEYLKLSEKVESEYNGIEGDDDNESMEADEPYERVISDKERICRSLMP